MTRAAWDCRAAHPPHARRARRAHRCSLDGADRLDARAAGPGGCVRNPATRVHVGKTLTTFPAARPSRRPTYPSQHALTPLTAHSSPRRVTFRCSPASERHICAPGPRRAVAARQRVREVRASAPLRHGHPGKRHLKGLRSVGVIIGSVISGRPRDRGRAVPAVVGDGQDTDQGPAARAAVLGATA